MKPLTLFALMLISVGAAAQAQTPAQAPAQAPGTPAPATPAAASNNTAPPVPGTKIAVLDFQAAMLDSDPGKAVQEQYQKEIEPQKTAYEKVQKELTDLQAKLQNAATDVEKSALTRQVQDKTTEVQRAQEDAQRLSDDLQQRLLPPVAAAVNKIVDEYARENNLAVVLDPLTQPSNIVFANKATDITAEVLRRLNAAYAKDPKLTAPTSTVSAPANQ